MKKRAKSLLVYGVLALVLVVTSVFVANAVISYQQGDSSLTISYNLVTEEKAGRVYTPTCFTDCHLPFCFTPSSDSTSSIPVTKDDITQTLDFSQGSDQSILKETGVDYLTTETYTVDVPVYGTCEGERISNETGEKETYSYGCLLETSQEQKTREVWKPLKDISQLDLETGKEQCFDIWGKLWPKMGAEFYVDVIPHLNLQNREFILAEYAPWNSSITYKRKLHFNTTVSANVRIPYRINSSSGINGQIIWILPDESFSTSTNYTEWLYYNNLNDFYVVNSSETDNTGQRPHSIENSSRPDFNGSSVWKSSYHNMTLHFNQSLSDATGTFSPAASATVNYNAAGKFGYAVNFDGTFSIGVGDIVEDDTPYSIEFWIYPNGAPGDWRHIFNDWSNALSIRILDTNTLTIDTNQYASCGNGIAPTANVSLSTSAWHHIVVTTGVGDSQLQVYQDGALVVNETHCAGTHTGSATIGGPSSAYDSGMIDEFRIINKTLSFDEVRARYWEGVYGRSELGSESGINSTDANENNGDAAISAGISQSSASASAQLTDQQIYTRSASTQALGKFDVVAVLGNQRWAFNYVSSDENTSGFTSMANMTPVLYVWESQNLTSSQIIEQVKALINSTKL